MQVQRGSFLDGVGVLRLLGVLLGRVGCGTQCHAAHAVLALGKTVAVPDVGAYVREGHAVFT